MRSKTINTFHVYQLHHHNLLCTFIVTIRLNGCCKYLSAHTHTRDHVRSSSRCGRQVPLRPESACPPRARAAGKGKIFGRAGGVVGQRVVRGQCKPRRVGRGRTLFVGCASRDPEFRPQAHRHTPVLAVSLASKCHTSRISFLCLWRTFPSARCATAHLFTSSWSSPSHITSHHINMSASPIVNVSIGVASMRSDFDWTVIVWSWAFFPACPFVTLGRGDGRAELI